MKVYKFKCDSCGSKNYIKTDDGYKCEYCGSIQDVIMPEQPKPEVPHDDASEARYIDETKMNRKQKSLLVRLLICIFAGYFGVHKFMEGKIVLGIIYLVSYGLFGVGVFIDIIRYIINIAHSGKTSGDSL